MSEVFACRRFAEDFEATESRGSKGTLAEAAGQAPPRFQGRQMHFAALPPEVNSGRMYAGPGPLSLTAAAVAWENLASELHFVASSYRTVIAGLTSGRWLGASSLAMASAFGPYVAWTTGAAARDSSIPLRSTPTRRRA